MAAKASRVNVIYYVYMKKLKNNNLATYDQRLWIKLDLNLGAK